MGQSLVKNYIHIVFSTKHRQSLILPSIETELFSYLGGICNNLECHVLKVGGYKTLNFNFLEIIKLNFYLNYLLKVIDFQKYTKFQGEIEIQVEIEGEGEGEGEVEVEGENEVEG